MKYVVSALYKFVRLNNVSVLQKSLLDQMKKHRIKGTFILAHEGINGTVAGSRKGINALLTWLKSHPQFKDLDHKESLHKEIPFHRSKVKIKKEIVTLGIKGIDPNNMAGTYVKPKDWNKLISDPDVTLVDTRNNYEVKIGSFKNAINPHTTNFREFPQYVNAHLNPKKHKKVAMYCTGGIRCEKSTSYLKKQGFKKVYHLQGGILKYLEDVPKKKSLWKGECFVFDGRVAVNHALKKGKYDQCFACRMPVSAKDKLSKDYQPGVSCSYCVKEKSELQRLRLAERQKQISLAKKRGGKHIGPDSQPPLLEGGALR